jgi:phospholipid/cholesterol/gamma-HCH transport system substrate-binding protein
VQKQAPTFTRLLTMVIFALSCFGLLLFLWLAFGGPIPLKPKGYRFDVAIPEANQLAIEADVRTSGVSIGKIRAKRKATSGNRTIVSVELERKYAPLDADARVVMRSKTLLGEKYLEITRGTPGGPKVPEDGRLPDASVADTVEVDEVLGILDPTTRRMFRAWQQNLGKAAAPRAVDLNDAFGNLPRFAARGTDLLTVLDQQAGAVRGLVKNTGVTFAALTENEAALRNLVVNTDRAFSATSQEREALAETFQIFPTFLDESRATMRNLESFSRQARPLVRDLRPAMQDLRPALRDVRALSPDLERFYRNLDPLIEASEEGLPALRDVLDGARPLLGQLQPFLEQLNPILEWLEVHQHTTADFFANGGGALVDTNEAQRTGEERGHYLGQYGLTGPDSLILSPNRSAASRGNAYLAPFMQTGARNGKEMILPSWDCKNTPDGEHTTTKRGTSDEPSCWVSKLPGPTRFPHIGEANYGPK